MDDYVFATGAYGHEASGPDWLAGKDFKIVNGPYFSIRDVEKLKENGIYSIYFQNVKREFTRFAVDLYTNPTGEIITVSPASWFL